MEKFSISLDNLQIHARHGIIDQENKVGNSFEVNVSIDIPIDFDPETDDPDNTISYADIYDIVRSEMGIPSKLLETVAWRISRRLKFRFPQIISGIVGISKCPPPIPGIVGNASVKIIF